MKNNILFHDTYRSPIGLLYICTDEDQNLVSLSTVDTPVLKKNYTVKKGDCAFIAKQLDAYFHRELTVFTIPLKWEGTPFQKTVWNALTQIPCGTTTTYQAIAGKIGKPAAARAVGNAVGANRILIIVPCHRVVQSSGALGGFSAGTEKKEFLLKLEGVWPSLNTEKKFTADERG